MTIKSISITEEAYKKLANLREGNESFSEIIIRVARKKKPKLREFFGILSKESTNAIEKAIKDDRKEHARLHEKRHKLLMEKLG